jgi:hypothetical protein
LFDVSDHPTPPSTGGPYAGLVAAPARANRKLSRVFFFLQLVVIVGLSRVSIRRLPGNF